MASAAAKQLFSVLFLLVCSTSQEVSDFCMSASSSAEWGCPSPQSFATRLVLRGGHSEGRGEKVSHLERSGDVDGVGELRGAHKRARTDGRHSSVFLQDAAARRSNVFGDKEQQSPVKQVEPLETERDAEDILRGAIEREEKELERNIGVDGKRMTVRGLKEQLLDMGVDKSRVDKCLEKGELLGMLEEMRGRVGKRKNNPAQPSHSHRKKPVVGKNLLWDGELGGRTCEAADQELLRRAGMTAFPDFDIETDEEEHTNTAPTLDQNVTLDSKPSVGEEMNDAIDKEEEHPQDLGPALEERAGESGDEEDPKLRSENLQDRGDLYDAQRVREAQDLFEERQYAATSSKWVQKKSIKWLKQELGKMGVDLRGVIERQHLERLLLAQRAIRNITGAPFDGEDEAARLAVDAKVGADSDVSAEVVEQVRQANARASAARGRTKQDSVRKHDREGGDEEDEDEESSASSGEIRRYGEDVRKGQGEPTRGRSVHSEGRRQGLERPGHTRNGSFRNGGLVSGDGGGDGRRRRPHDDISVQHPWKFAEFSGGDGRMRVHANDRLGNKASVLVRPFDTIKDLKQLLAPRLNKNEWTLKLGKANIQFKDHITLSDYEIHDGYNIEVNYRREPNEDVDI